MKYLFTLFSLVFSSLILANPLNNIVVFGDSLSDNGNLYEYMQHKLPQSPPYYGGRFTNGLTWVEYLTNSYFPKNSKTHLLDYAFGGAAVIEESDDDGILFTLRREIDSYLLTHEDKADENSLFIVWIGSNNYLALSDDADKEKSLMQVNLGITQGLQRLAMAGAKTVLVLNLPDLGATPYARSIAAQEQMSYLTKRHNALLQDSMERLKNLNPSVQWLYFDAKNTLNDLFISPESYGFTNVTDTCYEAVVDKSSRSPVLRMTATINRLTIKRDGCDGYLFFDPLHPTATAHRLMAERARSFLDAAGIEFVS